MKTRRRLEAAARKQEILGSSLRVFARLGFDGATSKELAKAAGVSEALLYKYFPTKEAMYQDLASLLGSNKERLIGRLTQGTPSAESFVRTFYCLARLILDGPPAGLKDDSIDRLMGQSLLGDGAFAEAILESLFVPMVPYLAAGLETAHRSGDIECDLPSAERLCYLIHHFFGAIALFSLPKRRLLPYDDRDLMLREVLTFALRGAGFSEAALGAHLDFARLERAFTQLFQETQTS